MKRFLQRKRRLPLRLRLALWSAGLVIILSFALLLFINIREITTIPRIIRLQAISTASTTRKAQATPARIFPRTRTTNPLELALLLELRSVSLIGLVCVGIAGGAGAYWLAGVALRPLRQVNEAAKQISAQTLHTRLALDGPRDEVRELSDTFDAMLERLENTFEQQKRFVGDIAHELRTPLASLRTNLEVMATDEHATVDEYRAMIATQERALTRLERLVADMLILARSEQPTSHNPITLETLLEEVIDELQPVARVRHIHMQLQAEEEVVVAGDEGLLTRVFSNLIENAIHYNHDEGEVVVTLERNEQWAIVRVIDTGPGIPQEEQAHIFERFYRLDSARTRHKGGSGLGLSIVAALVQQHSGRVYVERSSSAGSTFTVELPLMAIPS